jgi:hypothetical protein
MEAERLAKKKDKERSETPMGYQSSSPYQYYGY